MTATRIDGRAARAQRTRDAVTTALLDLISEGGPKPNATRIAERANVSIRSIYVHFSSIEDLYRAAAELTTKRILSLLTPIDPAQPLDTRIDLLCGQRARINEQLGPILRAADFREATSSELADVRNFGRQASRDQLRRVFAGELAALDPEARRRRVGVIDTLISEPAWTTLRSSTHALDPDEARVAITEAVRAVVQHQTR
jgi:AcrR family transcriptional regulator